LQHLLGCLHAALSAPDAAKFSDRVRAWPDEHHLTSVSGGVTENGTRRLGVAAAAGKSKPWIAFSRQKLTRSGFDKGSNHLVQGLLLGAISSCEEVGQFNSGGLST
jgi:hypothetical protein